jgi:hypothetical protein
MTAPTADPIEAAVAKLTRDEAKILAHYAAGESLDEVARATHITLTAVSYTVDTVAKRDRSLAHKIAVAWQKANPVGRANSIPVPVPPLAAGVVPRSTSGEVTDLFVTALGSDVPKLVRLAEKTQALVDELRVLVDEHEKGKELRAEAEQLEARLAEIRQQLGPKKAEPGPDWKAIRAWATANDVACPTHGRVPTAVVDAYQEATRA